VGGLRVVAVLLVAALAAGGEQRFDLGAAVLVAELGGQRLAGQGRRQRQAGRGGGPPPQPRPEPPEPSPAPAPPLPPHPGPAPPARVGTADDERSERLVNAAAMLPAPVNGSDSSASSSRWSALTFLAASPWNVLITSSAVGMSWPGPACWKCSCTSAEP